MKETTQGGYMSQQEAEELVRQAVKPKEILFGHDYPDEGRRAFNIIDQNGQMRIVDVTDDGEVSIREPNV